MPFTPITPTNCLVLLALVSLALVSLALVSLALVSLALAPLAPHPPPAIPENNTDANAASAVPASEYLAWGRQLANQLTGVSALIHEIITRGLEYNLSRLLNALRNNKEAQKGFIIMANTLNLAAIMVWAVSEDNANMANLLRVQLAEANNKIAILQTQLDGNAKTM